MGSASPTTPTYPPNVSISILRKICWENNITNHCIYFNRIMLAYWKRIQCQLRCSMTHHRELLVRWHTVAQRISMIPRVLPLLCPRMGWTPEGDTVCIRTHGLRCQWRGTCSPFSCPSRYDKTSSNAILQYLPPWNLMVCYIFSRSWTIK